MCRKFYVLVLNGGSMAALESIFGLVLLLAGLLFVFWVPAEILRKAGFSRLWALLMPFTGFLGMIVFAMVEWPAERRLAWYRFKDGADPDLVPSVERYAVELEKEGDWKGASEVFEELRQQAAPDTAEYYANCLKRLGDRVAELT